PTNGSHHTQPRRSTKTRASVAANRPAPSSASGVSSTFPKATTVAYSSPGHSSPPPHSSSNGGRPPSGCASSKTANRSLMVATRPSPSSSRPSPSTSPKAMLVTQALPAHVWPNNFSVANPAPASS